MTSLKAPSDNHRLQKHASDLLTLALKSDVYSGKIECVLLELRWQTLLALKIYPRCPAAESERSVDGFQIRG